MFTIKLEYGIGKAGTTESCVTFDNYEDTKEFAHKMLDEVLDAVWAGAEADNGIIRIWDDETKGALINDLCSWEH